jgi:hypothetical protein
VGKSPEERFKSAAKNVVDDALASQAELTAQLNEQATQFIPKKYGDYGKVLKKIGGASGRTFPQYVSTAENRFFDTAANLTAQGRRDLRNFEPGLINSRSTRQVTDYLAALGQDFARGVQQVGESGRDRLFALPEQAQRAFSASAQNPAFENLANVAYVNFAKEPPTIQNDAMKMYRNMWTYNV